MRRPQPAASEAAWRSRCGRSPRLPGPERPRCTWMAEAPRWPEPAHQRRGRHRYPRRCHIGHAGSPPHPRDLAGRRDVMGSAPEGRSSRAGASRACTDAVHGMVDGTARRRGGGARACAWRRGPLGGGVTVASRRRPSGRPAATCRAPAGLHPASCTGLGRERRHFVHCLRDPSIIPSTVLQLRQRGLRRCRGAGLKA